MHAVRAIAGSSPEIQLAQRWIMEAMGLAVDNEQLRNPGRFQRLDIMLATNLIEKFSKMRRNRSLSNHHIHFLQQISRMEYGAQNEERLLTGREMIRAICYLFSVRSELGQHRISRDIFKLYGARPPSDEMRASIHAHFIEQRRKPKNLDFACQLYDLSKDKLGEGARSYEWLMSQIDGMMLRDKEEWNISMHE
eukprot:5137252-Pyramimonas_sp.AAC.1